MVLHNKTGIHKDRNKLLSLGLARAVFCIDRQKARD
jgi:hypothetical protein